MSDIADDERARVQFTGAGNSSRYEEQHTRNYFPNYIVLYNILLLSMYCTYKIRVYQSLHRITRRGKGKSND